MMPHSPSTYAQRQNRVQKIIDDKLGSFDESDPKTWDRRAYSALVGIVYLELLENDQSADQLQTLAKILAESKRAHARGKDSAPEPTELDDEKFSATIKELYGGPNCPTICAPQSQPPPAGTAPAAQARRGHLDAPHPASSHASASANSPAPRATGGFPASAYSSPWGRGIARATEGARARAPSIPQNAPQISNLRSQIRNAHPWVPLPACPPVLRSGPRVRHVSPTRDAPAFLGGRPGHL